MIRINLRSMERYISCGLILLPCVFYDIIYSNLSGISIIIIYITSFILAFISMGGSHILTFQKWKVYFLVLWGLIFLVSIFNRNGDIANNNYLSSATFLIYILYCAFFVVSDDLFTMQMLKTLAVLLFVHIPFGFYFLINPDAHLNIGTTLLHLQTGTNSYRDFTKYISSGAFLGLSDHYSTSGVYMALAVIIIAAFLFYYRKKEGKWNEGILLVFALFLLALVLSQKRAQFLFGIVAIIAIYFVGYLQGDPSKRIWQMLGILGVSLIGFLIIINIPSIGGAFERILQGFTQANSVDETLSGRISLMWLPAWNDILQYPIFGIGWRQFRIQNTWGSGSYLHHSDTHNVYLQLICENGIFIGLFIIILIFAIFILTWRTLSKYKYYKIEESGLFLLFSFGYQTFFILYCLTGNPLYDIECFFPYMISCAIAFKYIFSRNNQSIATAD